MVTCCSFMAGGEAGLLLRFVRSWPQRAVTHRAVAR